VTLRDVSLALIWMWWENKERNKETKERKEARNVDSTVKMGLWTEMVGSAALCNVEGERIVSLYLSEVGYLLDWKS
jgi:hypothetical protein